MADKKVTLATKCGCGESTTDLDYKDIASKCDKCGEQLQIASLHKEESNKPWEKAAKKTTKTKKTKDDAVDATPEEAEGDK